MMRDFPLGSMYIKTLGEMLGDIPAKPTKTAHYFQVYRRKKAAVRMCLIPKSLTSDYFPTNGRNWTRTSDLIDVNDELAMSEYYTEQSF
jgi:hypothetical protein